MIFGTSWIRSRWSPPMNAINLRIRQHMAQINHYASFIGGLGLGYLVLHRFKCALPLSMALVFAMACIKTYLISLAEGRKMVPRGRSLSHIVAWWFLFGLLAALVILSGLAFCIAIWTSIAW